MSTIFESCAIIIHTSSGTTLDAILAKEIGRLETRSGRFRNAAARPAPSILSCSSPLSHDADVFLQVCATTRCLCLMKFCAWYSPGIGTMRRLNTSTTKRCLCSLFVDDGTYVYSSQAVGRPLTKLSRQFRSFQLPSFIMISMLYM
jgi:hypothetical protein